MATAGAGATGPSTQSQGEWSGSWYYLNRAQKWVFWIRDGAEGPEIRVQMLNTSTGQVERTKVRIAAS